MSDLTYFCPRCGILKPEDTHDKEVPDRPSGFLAIHWRFDEDAPLFGIPRMVSRTRFATFCRGCGEEVKMVGPREVRQKRGQESSGMTG